MTRRRQGRPRPPRSATHASLPLRTTHSTVPKGSRPKQPGPPRRRLGRIVEEDEASLVDLLDNLLSKGVVLSADLVLALANVDLVYVRLSALLCAADRVLPRGR